jgi:predicted anti-sigma-YlaC factor YlaD
MKMMVDCERSLDLLSDMRDGVLTEPEATLVRAHLDGCDDCNVVFLDLEVIVTAALSLRAENGLAYPDEQLLWERIGVRKRTVH